ncbi:MAG: cytochrome P450 [Polyangia bacterium]
MTTLPKGPGKLALLRMMFDLTYTLADMARDYGDPFTLPTAFGPMVVAVSPEGNKEIFSADPDIFSASAADSFGRVIRNSVLVTSGEEHRRQRRLLTPPFHGQRMRSYGNLMKTAAKEWTERLAPGNPFQMIYTTQAITLDVIIYAVFGVDHGQRVEQFRTDLLDVLGSFTPLIFLRPLQHEFGGIGPWARFQRGFRKLADHVAALSAEYRQKLDGREDILSLLLSTKDEEGKGLSAEEILDQLVTIVFAGHETTAVMLAWAFYLLHKYPDQLARLHEEIDPLPLETEPEAIAKLPFLEAVINETLRLYPPVHVIHRKLKKPMRLSGCELPAGTIVAAGAFATHRLSSIYPEPDKFVPQRFLHRTYSPFEFLPFGGGARRCLGAAFATYEMKQVLFVMLKQKRFELLETEEVRFAHRAGTVGPKGGIRMMVAREQKIGS